MRKKILLSSLLFMIFTTNVYATEEPSTGSIETVIVQNVTCSESSSGFNGEATLRGEFFLNMIESLATVVPDNIVNVKVVSADVCLLMLSNQAKMLKTKVIIHTDTSNPNDFKFNLLGIISNESLVTFNN